MFADGEKYREGDGSGSGAGRSGDRHGHFKGIFSRDFSVQCYLLVIFFCLQSLMRIRSSLDRTRLKSQRSGSALRIGIRNRIKEGQNDPQKWGKFKFEVLVWRSRNTFPLLWACSTYWRKVWAIVIPRLDSCKHINTLCGDSTISKPYWTAFYRIKWALQDVSELGYLFSTSPLCI